MTKVHGPYHVSALPCLLHMIPGSKQMQKSVIKYVPVPAPAHPSTMRTVGGFSLSTRQDLSKLSKQIKSGFQESNVVVGSMCTGVTSHRGVQNQLVVSLLFV